MKENIKNISVILGIMLISSVIVLLLLTICIWKMDGGANFLSAGVITAYIISGLIGGCLIGKAMGSQKFLWGLFIGFLYFMFLLLLGIAMMHIDLKQHTQIIGSAFYMQYFRNGRRDVFKRKMKKVIVFLTKKEMKL